jgi:hypothetical protein
MIWQPYKVTFRLKGPLHIGYHKVGNLQRTRYYVPARVVWGALTAHLTRKNGSGNYEETGTQVNASIKISYFYLATDPDNPLYPCFDPKKGMVFGKTEMPRGCFEGLFISSQASTALNYFQASAEEGSLHEVEFLNPSVQQNDTAKPVYLIGYLFIKKDGSYSYEKVESVLNRLQLGGERTYGFGRVEGCGKVVEETDLFFGLHRVHLEDPESPIIIVNQNSKVLLAHTLSEGLDQVSGEVEPVVGREWKESKSIHEPTTAKICWVPGSSLSGEKKFRITQDGIWQVIGLSDEDNLRSHAASPL